MKTWGIMGMKCRRMKRHIRDGFKNNLRNGWMSISSIGAVTVTLFLVGTFVAIMINVSQMANKVEEDVVIKALIDLTAEEDEITALGDEIEEIKGVESVQFSSKEEELDSLIAGMGDQGQSWELIEQDNPLNHA